MKNLPLFLLLACLAHSPAAAATVSLARSSREVTPEEIAGGAPAGGFVHDFFLTSDTDLLSVSRVQIDTSLFQDALGSDLAAPHAALTGLYSGLTADSFIDTPGDTFTAGGGFLPGPGDRSWADVSNDGPLQNFHLARLTVGQTGTFSGRIAVRGPSAPIYFPFNFALPGNASDLALLDTEPVYWHDAPPASHTPPPLEPPPTSPLDPPTLPSNPPGGSPAGPPASPLASISLTRQSRIVTAEEIAGGASPDAYVHEFFVTSATDILSINNVNIDVPLHQHTFGSDSEAPLLALNTLLPGASADSFITTPGDTGIAGGGFGHANSAWFDTSNDGATEDFLFARLTVEDTGTFAGSVSVRHDGTFVDLPFEFVLPGNESDMGLLALEPTFAADFPPSPPATSPVEAPPAIPSVEGPVELPLPVPPRGPERTPQPHENPPVVDPPAHDPPSYDPSPADPATDPDPTEQLVDITPIEGHTIDLPWIWQNIGDIDFVYTPGWATDGDGTIGGGIEIGFDPTAVGIEQLVPGIAGEDPTIVDGVTWRRSHQIPVLYYLGSEDGLEDGSIVRTFSYDAGMTETGSLVLFQTTGRDATSDVGIPEPSAVALMLAAAGGLLPVRRCRRGR